jgi:hypothetical protein
MPLPLGTAPHPTDAYNIVALLTPTKLVVVGLKPAPRTWFKCPHETPSEDVRPSSKSKSRMRGTLAWFPSVLPQSIDKVDQVLPEQKLTPTTPTLVYCWGNSLRLIRVWETKTKQSARNPRSGKTTEVEMGQIVFESAGKWEVAGGEAVLAIQWLNVNVGSFTSFLISAYELRRTFSFVLANRCLDCFNITSVRCA